VRAAFAALVLAAGCAVLAPGAGVIRCARNADCPPREYCDAAPGRCEGDGFCAPRPEACAQVYVPVCGCDGRTYGNACEAAGAGVRVAADGPCEAG
jgi:hypothetical protein